MSEFLMIIPAGWTELVEAQTFLDTHSEDYINSLIDRNEGWGAIEALMQDDGYIPMNASIQDFRMFHDGLITRIWYRLV